MHSPLFFPFCTAQHSFSSVQHIHTQEYAYTTYLSQHTTRVLVAHRHHPRMYGNLANVQHLCGGRVVGCAIAHITTCHQHQQPSGKRYALESAGRSYATYCDVERVWDGKIAAGLANTCICTHRFTGDDGQLPLATKLHKLLGCVTRCIATTNNHDFRHVCGSNSAKQRTGNVCCGGNGALTSQASHAGIQM